VRLALEIIGVIALLAALFGRRALEWLRDKIEMRG